MRETPPSRISLALGLALVLCLPRAGASLPAFPGAEGWGTETPAGRGPSPATKPPKVHVVTTTAASGPGSLLEGILMKEPRIIVFRVSGIINLAVDPNMLTEANSYFTIAGQTSPGGITIRREGGYAWRSYGIALHDFVWRFLRFRGKGVNDGIQFGPSTNFVIDHCDFSGGTDETTDLFYSSRFTMQWCTIANSEGTTSKGTIVAGKGDRITFHHNLWAHHFERAPAFFWDNPPADHGLIDLRNNVVYNIKGYSSFFAGNEWATPGEGHANMVGNTWKEGPNMSEGIVLYGPYFAQVVKVYDEDNCFYLKSGAKVGCESLIKRYGATNRVSAAWPTPAVTTTSSEKAYEEVLSRAGAMPKDPMNIRVEKDVRTGTGVPMRIDDSLMTVNPPAPADADADGMPDFWETAMKLDPKDAGDNVEDADGDGYLNIEEYANDVAQARLCRPYHNPVYPIPENWPDYNPGCASVMSAFRAPRSAGGRSLRAARVPGADAVVRIELAGSAPSGWVRILDARGREHARMPAAPTVLWDGGRGAGRVVQPGMWVAEWDDGRTGAVRGRFLYVP